MGSPAWAEVTSGNQRPSLGTRYTHLIALLFKGTVILFSLTSWPGYLK